MKKKLLALGVASVFGVLAMPASAGVVTGTGPAVPVAGDGTIALPTGTTLQFNEGGVGHILLVPYYTVQNGNATLINLVNTDTVNGKAVKVRFRGAQNSDDVFDFQVYLSPGDVWAASVTQAADGRAQLSTADNSCTLPANVNQPFVTGRLPGDTEAAKAAGTREGYVEILTMADIPPFVTVPPAAETLYMTTKHKTDGSVNCGTALTSLNADIIAEGGAAGADAAGLESPTTGLMANWTIINVPAASAWSGQAAAIEARTAGGLAGSGNFVWFPQMSTPVAGFGGLSADPLLLSGKIAGAYYDLPDLSTPYVTAFAVGAPERQASALTDAIAKVSVTNEYITDPGVFAQTDWVFSMPTRRYAVAIDYTATVAANRMIFNPGVFVTTGAYGTDSYFAAAPGTAQQVNPATPLNTNSALAANIAGSGANVTRDGFSVCTQLGAGAIRVTDRSERTLAGSDFVISPGTPTTLAFCGETNVLSFNAGGGMSVLGGEIARANIDIGSFVDGWARINTQGNPSGVTVSGRAGLPVLGAAFVQATNPNAAPGVSGNYGAAYEHRFVRP